MSASVTSASPFSSCRLRTLAILPPPRFWLPDAARFESAEAEGRRASRTHWRCCRHRSARGRRRPDPVDFRAASCRRRAWMSRSKLPGRLERVLVTIGDRVSAGQLVATLDARGDRCAGRCRRRRRERCEGRARLGGRRARQRRAGARPRARNLFERGALPRQRLDGRGDRAPRGRAQRDLAQANLAQAEAAARRAREVRRDASLTSPIDWRRRRAQLRSGQPGRPGRQAGRRRRRHARAEARGRRRRARGRAPSGRHAGAS